MCNGYVSPDAQALQEKEEQFRITALVPSPPSDSTLSHRSISEPWRLNIERMCPLPLQAKNDQITTLTEEHQAKIKVCTPTLLLLLSLSLSLSSFSLLSLLFMLLVMVVMVVILVMVVGARWHWLTGNSGGGGGDSEGEYDQERVDEEGVAHYAENPHDPRSPLARTFMHHEYRSATHTHRGVRCLV